MCIVYFAEGNNMRLFLVLLCAMAATAVQLDLNDDDDDTQLLHNGKDNSER